jgi:MerC mercury resistance protein
MKMVVDSQAAKFDAIAVGLSGACLVHCLILPVAAAAMPIFASAAEAEWVHWAFVVFAIPTSILALRHQAGYAFMTLVTRIGAGLGLILLTLGALGWPSHDLETPITIAGGLVLASVHIANFAQRRQAKKPCNHTA